MIPQEITMVREAFDARLAMWAPKNGYKRRGNIWQHPGGYYLTIRREPGDAIKFVAERRAGESGKLLCDVSDRLLG